MIMNHKSGSSLSQRKLVLFVSGYYSLMFKLQWDFLGYLIRPDMIDPAVLRPGRLGKMLYVPLPDIGGRVSILKTLIRQKPISSDVDLVSIASSKQCEGLSGADLAALVCR